VQDKSYAIAIVVVLGICCLGMYVAISGYLNSNPPAPVVVTPGVPATEVVITVPTDTPAPTTPVAALPGAPTPAPIPSPLGAFQTITAATTVVVATQPPTAPKPAPTASPTPALPSGAPQCGSFPFCVKGGPPDYDLGPGGDPCPRNYIWGRVVDVNGKALPNVRIRYRLDESGESGDSAFSKGPPDVHPGVYYIVTGQPGGKWVVWLVDSSGNQASPQISITTQAYSGAGNCPTRMDFVQK